MKQISEDALIQSGFVGGERDKDGDRIFTNGKLSIFHCGSIDGKFYLNHQYPFDFMVTHIFQLEKLMSVINANGLIHLGDPALLETKKSA